MCSHCGNQEKKENLVTLDEILAHCHIYVLYHLLYHLLYTQYRVKFMWHHLFQDILQMAGLAAASEDTVLWRGACFN